MGRDSADSGGLAACPVSGGEVWEDLPNKLQPPWSLSVEMWLR